MGSEPQQRSRYGLALAVLASVVLLNTLHAAPDSVQARLVIPPAETYVIGDDIPLHWEFLNTGPAPLAFLWEGCCRLNGRLTVTRQDQPLTPIPPGTAIAHQFAKAERLDPGKPTPFSTLVADWVRLKDTGRYRLQGRYIGVLPDQKPQVPAGLGLWRSAAETDPAWLEVLSPDDYLAQRDARARRRHLRLDLQAHNQAPGSPPIPLPPLEPLELTLTFSNVGADTPHTLAWPGQAQLWLLNSANERVGIRNLAGPGEPIPLAPGQSVSRHFALQADDLLDAPLGSYRIFIDWPAAEPDVPRVPSNPLSFLWRFDRPTLTQLLEQAVAGPKTGLRNKPLKHLRVHLAEIRPLLDELPPQGFSAATARLLQDLQLAACLKTAAPQPGLVTLQARLPAATPWTWHNEIVTDCFHRFLPASSDPIEHLARLVDIRRHLGWSLKVQFLPETNAPLAHLLQAAAGVRAHMENLAGPPVARIPSLTTTNALELRLQTNLAPAHLALKLSVPAPGRSVQLQAIRKTAQPGQPALLARLQPKDMLGAAWQPLPDPAALESFITQSGWPAPQIVILAQPHLAWSDLTDILQPLAARAWTADLVLRE